MAKLLACALAAAAMLGGQTVVTYRSTADRSEQPYALYVPKSYDPARRYPVVVSLHEEESNHVVNLQRVFGIPARYGESGLRALGTLAVPRAVDYLVACPFARGTMGYQGIAEQDVYDVLADVKRRYPVDEDRVYLTGSSMGGGGALAGADAPRRVGSGGAGVRRCVPRHGGSGAQRAACADAVLPRRYGSRGRRGVFAPVAAASAHAREPGGVHRISGGTAQCVGLRLPQRRHFRLVRQVSPRRQSGPRPSGGATS